MTHCWGRGHLGRVRVSRQVTRPLPHGQKRKKPGVGFFRRFIVTVEKGVVDALKKIVHLAGGTP